MKNRRAHSKSGPCSNFVVINPAHWPFVDPKVRLGRINLLQAWHNDALTYSSHLAIKPLYNRDVVNRVYSVLDSFFPSSFFDYTFGKDEALRKIGLIKRLLLNPKNPALVIALKEVSDILCYAEKSQPTLWENLKKQKDNPDQFQATLYEAFIASRFERLGHTYRTDEAPEGKPIDGRVNLGNRLCRIECKMQFAPKRDEFDVLRRSVDELLMAVGESGVGGGFGIVLRIHRPATPRCIESVRVIVRKIFAKYEINGYQFTDREVLESPGAEIEVLPLGAIDSGERSTDSVFVARLEANPQGFTSADIKSAPIELQSLFFYSKKDVMAKLQDVIKKARKQHRKRGLDKLIICIDSQELPDFQLGMFQGINMLEDSLIRADVLNLIGDSALIITRRIYHEAGVDLKTYLFAKEEDRWLDAYIYPAFRSEPIRAI